MPKKVKVIIQRRREWKWDPKHDFQTRSNGSSSSCLHHRKVLAVKGTQESGSRKESRRRRREEHRTDFLQKESHRNPCSIQCLPSRDDKRQDKSVKWPLGSFFLWFSYKVYMDTCDKIYNNSDPRHKDYSYTHVFIEEEEEYYLKRTWRRSQEEEEEEVSLFGLSSPLTSQGSRSRVFSKKRRKLGWRQIRQIVSPVSFPSLLLKGDTSV